MRRREVLLGGELRFGGCLMGRGWIGVLATEKGVQMPGLRGRWWRMARAMQSSASVLVSVASSDGPNLRKRRDTERKIRIPVLPEGRGAKDGTHEDTSTKSWDMFQFNGKSSVLSNFRQKDRTWSSLSSVGFRRLLTEVVSQPAAVFCLSAEIKQSLAVHKRRPCNRITQFMPLPRPA